MITRKVFEPYFSQLVASGLARWDEPMSLHTSFRIGGPADIFCVPRIHADLVEMLCFAMENSIPWMILGRGSNLLVADKGIRGMVISTQNFNKISIDENYVSAFSGASMRALADFAMEHGLAGLEFAHGIPGSVGGGVFMNAGAYGAEIKDVLYCSKCLIPDVHALRSANPILHLKAEEHAFRYRHSALQDRGLIHLSSVFRLVPEHPKAIRARIDDLNAQRWSKQPMDLPSAGSIFKRPEGHFTGKLVDECGLRGFRIGDAAVSDKHCGFIVNLGAATAADVKAVIDHVRAKVLDRYGVVLQTEVRIIGEW